MEIEKSKELAENLKAEGNAHFEKKTYIPAAEAYQKGIEVFDQYDLRSFTLRLVPQMKCSFS